MVGSPVEGQVTLSAEEGQEGRHGSGVMALSPHREANGAASLVTQHEVLVKSHRVIRGMAAVVRLVKAIDRQILGYGGMRPGACLDHVEDGLLLVEFGHVKRPINLGEALPEPFVDLAGSVAAGVLFVVQRRRARLASGAYRAPAEEAADPFLAYLPVLGLSPLQEFESPPARHQFLQRM